MYIPRSERSNRNCRWDLNFWYHFSHKISWWSVKSVVRSFLSCYSSTAISYTFCNVHVFAEGKTNIHKIIYYFPLLLLLLWLSTLWWNVCKMIYPNRLMWAFKQFISGLHEVTFHWLEIDFPGCRQEMNGCYHILLKYGGKVESFVCFHWYLFSKTFAT